MFWMAGPKNSLLTSCSNSQKETLKTLLLAMKRKGLDSWKTGNNLKRFFLTELKFPKEG
jgi:hypothetical protein